jgi:hypothetical protein
MQQVVEQCVGVDIAKNAVQRAAKLNTEVTWVVGTGALLLHLIALIKRLQPAVKADNNHLAKKLVAHRLTRNLTERTWRCEQGHSYDVAKQGYVNLHVVQHKHSNCCK